MLNIDGEIDQSFVRLVVFTAVTMKNFIFCDVTLCGLHHQGGKEVILRSLLQFLVTANVEESRLLGC
jgi:hypothetical protein